MEQSDIEDAAMFLLHLRTQRTQVSAMPGELAPKSIDDAYAIQDALHRFAGWPIEILKVGCTSELAQAALGIPHPIGGRVPSEGVFMSGATIPRSFLAGASVLECEIALQVGADGVVEAAAPAIEVVNSRFVDTLRAGGVALIADNSGGAGVVLGSPVPIADVGDLAAVSVTLRAGGQQLAEGTGAALIDGPRGSVDWTLDHEASRGREVAPGTWIITGTCTGLTPTEPGTTYEADFGAFGSVGFTLQ